MRVGFAGRRYRIRELLRWKAPYFQLPRQQ
jgi:hypothetical protein